MESGQLGGMKVTLDDSATVCVCVCVWSVVLLNQQTGELRVRLKIHRVCARACARACACVCAPLLISGDNTMWIMPRRLTNSADAHAHTSAPNTPAKVTQAPASKFTHCSQGHTCACVYENSPPGRKQFDTTSISHPSSQALLSFLTTAHFYLFYPPCWMFLLSEVYIPVLFF